MPLWTTNERLPFHAVPDSPRSDAHWDDDDIQHSPRPASTRYPPSTLPFFFRFPWWTTSPKPRPRTSSVMMTLRPRSACKLLLVFIASSILLGLALFEPHIEIAFYSRQWVGNEITPTVPLGGCFEPERVSPEYNMTRHIYGPKTTEVHSGLPMRFGMDCYEFAGTIESPAPPPLRPWSELYGHGDAGPAEYEDDVLPKEERTHFHSYWRVDLAPFGERQEQMLKSFFATQNTHRSLFILWSNGQLTPNPILQRYLDRFPQAFELRVANVTALAAGTALEGSSLLDVNDGKAWIDGDLVRLLVVWRYGGVWVDMDSLLTRNLEPLLEHEFVTQWDCYDKPYLALNGALLHFHKRSPYLCEAFHVMASSRPPRKDSTDWGALLYLKLWRRLVTGGIPPFKILPFCFSDGRACRLDNRIPDPFEPDGSAAGSGNKWWAVGTRVGEAGGLESVLEKVFAVHLHNQWEKEFPKGGWVERLLLNKYERVLGDGNAEL
ncbi:glycosyltransferase family 32 protein [Pisolithus thermaeus]|nr:glycosyltransferase family 32 protein [Pisolithus thermaeus]